MECYERFRMMLCYIYYRNPPRKPAPPHTPSFGGHGLHLFPKTSDSKIKLPTETNARPKLILQDAKEDKFLLLLKHMLTPKISSINPHHPPKPHNLQSSNKESKCTRELAQSCSVQCFDLNRIAQVIPSYPEMVS